MLHQLLLADENVPKIVISELRQAGFDIQAIQEISPSIPDIEVCELASKRSRIVLTSDKDFGELVVRSAIPVPGIILLRLGDATPPEMANLVRIALEKDLTWHGCFTVISKDMIRIRKITFATSPDYP